MKQKALLILPIILLGCQQGGSRVDTQSAEVMTPRDETKVYSLLGEELPEIQLTAQEKESYEKNLKEARGYLDVNPDSLELIIWYGRRFAYLGKYFEAIDVYSSAIEKFPSSYRLRRHRGHRYITTRQFEKAIEDFEMAAFYSLNAENRTEPDGIPNKLNKPVGNDKFNIWYHYGLAHYLSGRFDKALSAYNRCMEFSTNNDLLAATSYWLYMTYKKIGNPELADQILEGISSKMKVIENDAYLDLLLLFKGEKNPEVLAKKAFSDGGEINEALGYGIGNYYQQQGNTEKANEIFLKILESPNWFAFGYIAAEAELTSTFPVPSS
ncbi:tetratricopeptide repeat protein [Ekhidna sp.]